MIEVRTLKQDILFPDDLRNADVELANAVNAEKWTIVDVSVVSSQGLRRIVTLTREVTAKLSPKK